VVDAHEIDVAGISAVLSRFEQRIHLVETTHDADVVLYGVREQQSGHDTDLHSLLRSHPATVVLLGWRATSPQSEWALSCGAHGHLSKTLGGEELVAKVERIHRSRDRSSGFPDDGHCHPGLRLAGLTPRELEVVGLITRGLTNQEIADRAYISINSVKTYVRTAYRKIGVVRRSQAVSWGVQHGLDVAHDAVPVGAPV
jgi:DNA-binding NarL/FixJ family response regulator